MPHHNQQSTEKYKGDEMRHFRIIEGICFWVMFIACIMLFVTSKLEHKRIDMLINNSLDNLNVLKRECEKDLPRNSECVLVYDYVPVDKE